ncbi:MAG TPA: T9SS type A sorting domain-containing protein [Nitrosomonas sp.]|nr:T9SS type A sorting domain-containing protein [Nitrosomonas sp.]
MKIMICLAFLMMVCIAQLSFAQNAPLVDTSYAVYPLQSGNVWQYYTYDLIEGKIVWEYGWTTKILGDTIMPDGKSYAIVKSDYYYLPDYERQEGPRVITYAGYYGQPILYDFSKSVGDTVYAVPLSGTQDSAVCTVQSLYYDNIFNLERRTWQFYRTASRTSAFLADYVTDGVGLTTVKAEAGLEFFLRGAIINGVKYGLITDVKNKDPYVGPQEFILYPNYPNPFNGSTTISFNLSFQQHVSLTIYDILGRCVTSLINSSMPSGFHKVIWNGKNDLGMEQPSGIYLYRLHCEHGDRQMKMLMVQ